MLSPGATVNPFEAPVSDSTMAAKRASDESEPAAKRVASSVQPLPAACKAASNEPAPNAKCATSSARLFSTVDAYRAALRSMGQTFAADLLGNDESHLDTADAWIKNAAPHVVVAYVWQLCESYTENRDTIATMLATMPALWTIPIGDIPFVIKLYESDKAATGEMESLFLSIPDASVANCTNPNTGDTVLHYAVENMHVAVVRHLALTLRCKIAQNRAGFIALFAPMIMGSVVAEPMEEIIRIFHRVRQIDPAAYNPNMRVGDTTVLGMLVKLPYNALIDAWLDSYACDGGLDSRRQYSAIGPNLAKISTFPRQIVRECCQSGNIEALRAHVTRGLVLSEVCDHLNDIHKMSFLVYACQAESTEFVNILLDAGISVSAGCTCGRSGIPPLTYAVHKRKLDHAELLLARGAKIDQRTDYLSPVVSMLHNSLMWPHVIRLLPTLDNKAMYAYKHCDTTLYRTSLLSIAVKSGDKHLVEAFIAQNWHDAIPDESLVVAIQFNHVSVLDLLLEHKPPQTLWPFRAAIATRHDTIITRLLSYITTDRDCAICVFSDYRVGFKCKGCGKTTILSELVTGIDATIRHNVY